MRTHEYFASTIGVTDTVLIQEAIRDARHEHGDESRWALELIHEYHSEVVDDNNKVVDELARVVVRRTD